MRLPGLCDARRFPRQDFETDLLSALQRSAPVSFARRSSNVIRLLALPAKALGSINFRGELFSATLTFVAGAAVRLVSSLILTRLLYPEAYGIIAVLGSVLFIIELKTSPVGDL